RRWAQLSPPIGGGQPGPIHRCEAPAQARPHRGTPARGPAVSPGPDLPGPRRGPLPDARVLVRGLLDQLALRPRGLSLLSGDDGVEDEARSERQPELAEVT